MLSKSEKLCHVLRALSIIELTLNLTFYANHPFFKSVKDHRTNEHNIFVKTLSNHCADKFDRKTNNREYCLLQQAKSASLNFTWSPFIQLLVLASVIKRQIRSIYPPTKGFFETFFNATVHPREQSSKDSLNVLWCRTNLEDCTSKTFTPNHFVPVLFAQTLDEFTKANHKKSKINMLNTTNTMDKDWSFETPSKLVILEDSSVLKTNEKVSKNVQIKKKSSVIRIDSIFKPAALESSHNPSEISETVDSINNDSQKSTTISFHPTSPVIPLSSSTSDIGCLLDLLKNLSDYEKLNLLKSVWVPPPNYKFPVTNFYGKNGTITRKGSCQEKYLSSNKYNKSDKYKVLVYSAKRDALFCLPCLLFRNVNVGKEEKLFTDGLCYWPSVTEKLKNHFTPSSTTTMKHHELAMTALENFLETSLEPEKHIRSYVNTAECELIKRNRGFIKLIFQMVLYLGQQGLAFRGHRDDLKHVLNENINAGNFAELLNLLARSNNETAIKILHEMPKNASYRSPKIQNECIDTIGETISSKLSEKINKSRWFSILADEACDITSKEQMALCVRFLNDERKIEERFLAFVECGYGQSGEAISKTILETLNLLKIDMKNCRGQGYDGTGAMAGSVRGVAKRISDIYPAALYCHCCSHKLNLCVCRMIRIELVRNTFDVSRMIADLLTDHAKEKRLYESTAKELYPDRPEKV